MQKIIMLGDGKYTFIKDGTTENLECRRYGEKWRDFIGDNAVHSLFNFAFDAQREIEALKRALFDQVQESRASFVEMMRINNSDNAALRAEVESWKARADRAEALHGELIMGVANKFPGETRHETARRYIRERENFGTNNIDQAAIKEGV